MRLGDVFDMGSTNSAMTVWVLNGNLMAPVRENQQYITIKETGLTRTDHIYTTIPLVAILEMRIGGKVVS